MRSSALNGRWPHVQPITSSTKPAGGIAVTCALVAGFFRLLPTCILLLLLGNGCFALAGEDQDWSFIQGVGGIAIHQPYRSKGNVIIPVDCDVSGLRTITIKPTRVNSGIIVKGVKSVRRNSTIYLQVATTVARGDGTTAACPSAKLADIPPGKYDVVYGMPSNSFGKSKDDIAKLGSIDVP